MTKGTNFKSLSIENGRSFNYVEIPLANQGIVLIQGDNGVGKSSIWDILEAILYGSTPTDHKKDELTKNDLDASYTVAFEKDGDDYTVSLIRRKGKWSYTIKKNEINVTDHSYKDAVAGLSKLIGLTKAEFEGSVHLTQEAQHILIKSELSERKKYISNFFGIDDRYDQIHLSAKQEVEKLEEQILQISSLSHTKQMLETELTNIEVKDINALQNELETLQQTHDDFTIRYTEADNKLTTWQNYHNYYEMAHLVKDPEMQIKELEKKIVDNKGKLKYIKEIKTRNEQARKMNLAIDELEESQKEILLQHPDVFQLDEEVELLEKELQKLNSLKNQNKSVAPLRKELTTIPKLEEIDIENLEKNLFDIQLEFQTHAKTKKTKEKGLCTECGSKFTVQDVQEENKKLGELKEYLDTLTEDYNLVKVRNTKVKRRKMLEEHLAKVPEFSKENEDRINFLDSFIPAKREYDETASSLKILSRMEVSEDVGNAEIPQIHTDIATDLETIEELKECQLAKKLLPKKPKESENALTTLKDKLQDEITELKTKLLTTTQSLGEYKKTNETHIRLTSQLEEINKKLFRLDDLKKEEFFWNKMVDAYGPKGLRIQQLEKMMNLVIKQLPVYCNILFKEKRLVFKHKVDPNNIKIIASREEIDETSNEVINAFQHDISAFSGGEKDRMSASFVLTLADCVPQHKKANILILDEVDAQLDADGKYRYTQQLLPILRKKHDSIFVISHNKEVQLANVYDQVWEIEKINHTSSIKMTKVNQSGSRF